MSFDSRPEAHRQGFQGSRGSTTWLVATGLAWTVGIICLTLWAFGGLFRVINARHEVRQFATAREAAAHPRALLAVHDPDFSLWSVKRINAWHETRGEPAPPPLAVLRIQRVGLEVPVLEGTDDWTLNRAVGHIADTAVPGTAGNSGIAGHRDGFFRALKDLAPGDTLELETLQSHETYRVERTWIVDPDDVTVLDPTPSSAVTLVTCYPFYFVGSAPQRYIVRAARVASPLTDRQIAR
jgi:sortase A